MRKSLVSKMDRRSPQSRFYRLLTAKSMQMTAVGLVTGGWATILFAAVTVPPGIEGHIEFVVWMGGALLVFIGCTAGMVAWVLNPAIDRRFSQHILRGAEEHKDLLSLAEYSRRHETIVQQLSRIEGALNVQRSSE